MREGKGEMGKRSSKMKKTGFVYILTNPSFREDWVKIGKTSRPVNTRSKELDNTAVPLPFEIYATLKTAEYANAETLIHKMIDRLTDKRIRKSREFFNIEPEVALDILRDVCDVIGGEIEIKGSSKADGKGVKDSSGKAFGRAAEEFSCKARNGASAHARLSGDGILVLKGSTISTTLAPSFKNRGYCGLRRALEKNHTIVSRVFARDYLFDSLSAAASVVLGRASNGKTCWKPKAVE